MQLLLAMHAQLHQLRHADHLKRTPLHWAAEMGRLDAAVTLLDYGCDVGAVDCNGRCVHGLALESGGWTQQAHLPVRLSVSEFPVCFQSGAGLALISPE